MILSKNQKYCVCSFLVCPLYILIIVICSGWNAGESIVSAASWLVGVRRRTNKNIVINSRLNVAAKTNKDGRTTKQKYKHGQILQQQYILSLSYEPDDDILASYLSLCIVSRKNQPMK